MKANPPPKGWRKVLLKDVAQVRTGIPIGEPTTGDTVRVPYLRVANVQAGRLDLDDLKEIEVDRSRMDRYLLHLGDVLMNEGGDANKLGRGHVWQDEVSPCLHQNHVFAVRTDPDLVNPHFLSALTNSSYGRTFFRRYAKNSTNLASIGSSELRRFPLWLPPLAEQELIADMLVAWDSQIRQAQRLVESRQRMKDALMHRFLSTPDASWDHAIMADVAQIDPDSLSANSAPDMTFRYITLSDVGKGFVNEKLETVEFRNAPGRARRMVQPGDFVMAMVRPNMQKFARILADHAGCIASTGFAVLRPKKFIVPDYLYHYLFSPHILNQINAIMNGSSYPAVTPTDIARLKVRMPPLEEQRKIGEVLTLFDNLIAMDLRALRLVEDERMTLAERLIDGTMRPRMDIPHPD